MVDRGIGIVEGGGIRPLDASDTSLLWLHEKAGVAVLVGIAKEKTGAFSGVTDDCGSKLIGFECSLGSNLTTGVFCLVAPHIRHVSRLPALLTRHTHSQVSGSASNLLLGTLDDEVDVVEDVSPSCIGVCGCGGFEVSIFVDCPKLYPEISSASCFCLLLPKAKLLLPWVWLF